MKFMIEIDVFKFHEENIILNLDRKAHVWTPVTR